MTVQDVINFVHEQREIRGKDRVMRNWNDASIALSVSHAIERDGFGWIITKGKISGFAMGMPRENEKVFDVEQVVCATPRDLAQLLLLFQDRFRGWTLRGFRRKKTVDKSLVTYTRVDRLTNLAQLTALNHV